MGGKVFLYWSKPGKTFQPQSCASTWDYICEIAPDSELWDSHWADIMRGTQTGLNRAEEEPSQSAASQVPLPLEEDTSAALEVPSTAEPTFRGLPIAWENVTTEENGKQRTGHWIVWNGNRSKREEFFKLAFPNQYNKVKKRVKFLGKAADDVLWLTGGQRTKLMYEILAWKYGLEEVSEQDNLDLIFLCQREEENKTADDLLSRLHWPNGLSAADRPQQSAVFSRLRGRDRILRLRFRTHPAGAAGAHGAVLPFVRCAQFLARNAGSPGGCLCDPRQELFRSSKGRECP